MIITIALGIVLAVIILANLEAILGLVGLSVKIRKYFLTVADYFFKRLIKDSFSTTKLLTCSKVVFSKSTG